MEKKDIKILCVDDEQDLLDLYISMIEQFGFTPLIAHDGLEALNIIEKNWKEILFVISDFNMPEINGIELCTFSKKSWPEIPFVIISGGISQETVLQALENKVSFFLEKPVAIDKLKEVFQSISEERVESILDEFEILEGFLEEAELLIEEIEGLMSNFSDDIEEYEASDFDRIFAIIHTIKGASGFFKPNTIHKYAHKFEDFLTQIKNKHITMSPHVVKLMFRGVDQITKLVGELKTNSLKTYNIDEMTKIFENVSDETLVLDEDPVVSGHEAGASAETLSKKEKSEDKGPKKNQAKVRDEVRVSVNLLDDFMEKSGEITVLRNMIIKLVKSIEKESGGSKDILLLGELLDEMHKVNGLIQDKIVELRKVPMKNIYRPISRVVRDLSPKLGKKIELDFVGENLKVDTSIAEVLSNSLIHMVRNCVDHGIEKPELRIHRGKNEAGTITLKSIESENEVIVSIEDDGGGIPVDRIQSKALEKGLVTQEQLKNMTKSEVLSLIFTPGFSTAEQITDISGRGVGTDMLKGSVEKIGGHIEINSEEEKGTCFVMHLPIPKSVLIINCLFIGLGREIFAIPREEVKRLARISKEVGKKCIYTMEGGTQVIEFENELLPLINLKELLGIKNEKHQENESHLEDPEYGIEKGKKEEDIQLVFLQTKKYKFVICVDEVLDMEDTVVKAVKNGVKAMNLFMGATFLGDGKLGLILALDKLADRAGLQLNNEVSKSSLLVHESKRNSQQFVLFRLGSDREMALNMKDVFRLEEISKSEKQFVGDQPVIVYRGETMPVFNLSRLMDVSTHETLDDPDVTPMIVVKNREHLIGFEVSEIVNLCETDELGNSEVRERKEIKSNLIIDGKLYPEIDLYEILIDISRTLRMDFDLSA